MTAGVILHGTPHVTIFVTGCDGCRHQLPRETRSQMKDKKIPPAQKQLVGWKAWSAWCGASWRLVQLGELLDGLVGLVRRLMAPGAARGAAGRPGRPKDCPQRARIAAEWGFEKGRVG